METIGLQPMSNMTSVMIRMAPTFMAVVVMASACGSGGGSSAGPGLGDSTSACSPTVVRPLVEQLIADVARWDDQMVISNNVSRMSLAPEIAKLQEIRRHVQGLSGPPCFAEPRDVAVDFMNGYIAFHTAFLGEESTVGLEAPAIATRHSFDSQLVSLASSVGITVRPKPTPTPFRIAKRASALTLTADDVGAGYQATSPGSACNQMTVDCALSAFIATPILSGDPTAILNIVAVFPTDAEASDFLARSARRPVGDPVTALTVGLGDESAGWYHVADSVGSITLYLRRANAVSSINFLGVSGPSRRDRALSLAAKQLDRMR